MIRRAGDGDVDAINEIHRRARGAYYGRYLDAADAAKDRTAMWRRMIDDPDTSDLVATDDDRPVAFLVVTRPPVPTEPIELTSLYALPSHFGSGVAARLYDEFDRSRDGADARLEVWDGNSRAQAFYRRRGWVPTRDVRPGVAGRPFVTWRLAGDAGSAAPSSG